MKPDQSFGSGTLPLLRRVAPAIGLFFIAPLVAEFLPGDLPITMLGALAVLAPLYGGGALVIREVVRRTGRGWPSIQNPVVGNAGIINRIGNGLFVLWLVILLAMVRGGRMRGKKDQSCIPGRWQDRSPVCGAALDAIKRNVTFAVYLTTEVFHAEASPYSQ